MRTHNEIARGFIGWYTMEATINLKKFGYLEKLLHKPNDSLAKLVFLLRLYDYMFTSTFDVTKMKGFVPDVCCLLIRYDIVEYLQSYTMLGSFPDKQPWSGIRKQVVKSQEVNSWHNNFALKQDCPLATLSIRGIFPHLLYKLAKEKPMERAHIITCVKLLTVPYHPIPIPCNLCGNYTYYIPFHIVMQCSALSRERCNLFDYITDVLEVNQSVNLFQEDDLSILAIMMGGYWDIFKEVETETYVTFVVNSLSFVSRMINTYALMN